MARYLPKRSVTSERCRVSRPQFPQPTHGTPGTMTPLLARKTVAFYDSGFPSEARVKICTVFVSSYTNTSGSLGEREMLWEHEPQASVYTAFSSSPKLSRVFV